jgi:hypothetical protein
LDDTALCINAHRIIRGIKSNAKVDSMHR